MMDEIEQMKKNLPEKVHDDIDFIVGQLNRINDMPNKDKLEIVKKYIAATPATKVVVITMISDYILAQDKDKGKSK